MRNASKSSSRLRAGFVAAGVLALGLAACDGSNAFAPVGVGPSVVELFAPEQTQGGAEFQVSARAVAAVRVDSIVVTVTGGGLDYRETQTNSGRENDVTYTFDVTVPSAVSDTIATISAVAFDAQGNQSVVKSRTIRLVDSAPPAVTLAVSADSVSQGDVVGLTVTSSDNIGVARTGVEVRGPAGQVVFTDSVSGSPTQQPSFQWQVGDAPAFGVHTVRAFAVDVSGNRGTSESVTIRVVFEDRDAPEVEILQPASPSFVVTAGDSVFVRARIQDNDAIELIRFRAFAQVGSAELGTLQSVERFTPRTLEFGPAQLVSDTTMSRYLRFDPASLVGDAPLGVNETLAVVVEAYDRSGLFGADTILVTLQHDVVAPSVSIGLPPAETLFYVGDDIPVEFTVADNQGPVRSGVNRITIQVQSIVGNAVTGDTTVTALSPDASFTLQDVGASAPIVNSRTFGYTIPGATRIETLAADRFFFIIVTARDVAGNVGADTIRVQSLGTRPVDPAAGVELMSTTGSPFIGPLGSVAPKQEPRRRSIGL
ncbi:MAG: hypothetical protein EA350_16125 [Gemmatimonadales bacterium]|nr:MAG: hypothetical protein EA350_16125 [Gemmatimonadales bacterium]